MVAFSEGREREREGLDAQYRAPESMTPPLVLALLEVAVVTAGVAIVAMVTGVLIYGMTVWIIPEGWTVDEDMGGGGTETLPAGWRERENGHSLFGINNRDNGV